MISALELQLQPSAFGQICEADIEAAWSAEIERRLVEIDASTMELIPWDDVRSELFGES
jgi:putative addiction module component (TIGR02574 family)